MVWPQNTGEHRHISRELDPNEGIDRSVRHEFLSVDAAVDDQRDREDGTVPISAGEAAYRQRNLERPKNVVDLHFAGPEILQTGRAGGDGAVDDFGVPPSGDNRRVEQKPGSVGKTLFLLEFVPKVFSLRRGHGQAHGRGGAGSPT